MQTQRSVIFAKIDVLPVGWSRKRASKLTSYVKNKNILLLLLKLNIGAYILNHFCWYFEFWLGRFQAVGERL